MKYKRTRTIIQWVQRVLIMPFTPVENPAAHKAAWLLTSVSLVTFLSTVGGAIATTKLDHVVSQNLIIASGILGFAYLLGRTKYFKMGAALLLIVFTLIPYLQIFSTDDYRTDNVTSIFVWGLLPIVLSNIFWSTRNVILLVFCHIFGLLLLPFIIPELVFTSVLHACGVTATISAAIIVSMYYRSQREMERTALLQKQTDELANTNQKLEMLLYVTSHDLKEPLRAIQNFSRMVNQRYSHQLDSKGQDFLQRIDRAAARLSLLIRDILTLSRAQKLEIPTHQIATEMIVQEVLSSLDARINETAAIISVATDLPFIYANRTWATQAIYNLVSNALKYTREGSAPEIAIVTYTGPEGLGLVVKDRGVGLSPDYTERIFQLFQRAVGREIEGTGAGLAIVRQVAERHGGHAWAKPRTGGGAEFVITFGPHHQPSHENPYLLQTISPISPKVKA